MLRRTILCFGLMLTSTLCAEENRPTVEALLQRMPLLSPENDKVQSFRATLVMPHILDNFVAKLAWAQDGRTMMLASTGPENVPCFFVSEKKAFLFDASNGSVILFDDAKPRVTMTTTPDNFEFYFGFGVKSEDGLKIDLASFIRSATEPAVSRHEDGRWQLTATSKSGKASVVSTFSENSFELQHFIVHAVGSKRDVLVEISEIAINDPEISFKPFPSTERFPDAVQILKPTNGKLSLYGAVIEMQRFMRIAVCQSAITNERFRDLQKFPLNIDWNRAKNNYYGVGRELRDLLNPSRIAKKQQTAIDAK